MKPLKVLLVLLIPGLVGLFIGVMLMVAYPDAMKVGAPLLCPDEKPDTFVVRYDVQTSDGTGTNFTLFCMDERGEFEEVGTWEPLLVLCGVVLALVYGFLFILWFLGLIRRLGRRGRSDDPTDPSSFADTAPPPSSDPFEAIREQQGPIIS